MTFDRTEQLVRDVFTEEAARAVDSREVLAAVRGRRPRRSYGLVLATAAVVVVVAAVATFVVPEVFLRSSVPPATEQAAAVTPTNVLVIGTDTVGNTDTMVIVQIHAGGSVSLVSLPRDTWVSVDGTMTRLNRVSTQLGFGTLFDTVGELTGVPLDHHVIVDVNVVAELADVVGGIPVCLRSATSDSYSGADFRAGEQVVTGAAALAFVRQRHGLPNSDLDRITRTQALLRSLLVKMKDADLAAVAEAVKGRVQTDPDLDLLGLATDLVRAKSVHVGTIPFTELSTPENGEVLDVDPVAVKRYVTDLPGTPAVTDDVPCVN